MTPGDNMRMLVADDDAAFRGFVTAAVAGKLDYEIVQARTGAEALRLALSEPRPDILLLDWLMPELTGVQVCKLVRASALAVQPYIVFATSRVRTEEALAALSAGGDDLLTKPVPPDVLLTRLSIPLVRTRSHGHRRVWAEIVAACQRGSGELAVTSGALTARVLVHQGKIAWAHLADSSDTLFAALDPAGSISKDMVQAVIRECRDTGSTLSETLVAWGLVERASLREALRGWITRKLEAICQLPNPSVLFLPVARSHSDDVLFELAEVAPEAWSTTANDPAEPAGSPERHSQSPSLVPPREWDAAFAPAIDETLDAPGLLQACQEVEGVLGVALLNRASGACLGKRGVDLSPNVAWALVQCMNANDGAADVEETIIMTRQRFHLATPLGGDSKVFLYALVDSTEHLAAARYGLKRLFSRRIESSSR